MLLVISAFLIGMTATYLFYNSDRARAAKQEPLTLKSNSKVYDIIIPLLKADEKRAITAIIESGGELQQNKLAAKLGISKVKATRILKGLEQKDLISKERHGFTNMVKLRK